MHSRITMNKLDKDIEMMQWKIQGLSECCGGSVSTLFHQEYSSSRTLAYEICSICGQFLSKGHEPYSDWYWK